MRKSCIVEVLQVTIAEVTKPLFGKFIEASAGWLSNFM